MVPAGRSEPDAEFPHELARLPTGRHGLPREFVARNQRERLIAGLAEAVAEHGYDGATIAHITEQASVSRRTFYEHFEGKNECFVAAFDMVVDQLRERIDEAVAENDNWVDVVRAAIAAMLRFLAAEPHFARLLTIEALVAGPIVIEHYDAAIRSLVPFLEAGRSEAEAEEAALSPSTEEAVVGGMLSLISRRVLGNRTDELEELLPDLVEFALTPYLGPAKALRAARGD